MNIKNKIILSLLLAILMLACDDTDFKGLYKEPPVPEAGYTRIYKCPDKPENSDWNTVSDYTQTYDGSSWQPADDDTTEYNESGSTTTCQFVCSIRYVWNGSNCVEDTENLYKTYYCQNKPEGDGYEWNIVSEYTQKSSDQGVSWNPPDDSVTEYSEYSSTTSCQYKCASGYMWTGSECSLAPTNTKTYVCNPLPDSNGAYSWNTVDSYTQNSYDNGETWTPVDDPETEYNATSGTTSCQFKCSDNYRWNGSECIYLNWESSGGYEWLKASEAMTYSNAQSFCSSVGGYIPSIDQLRLLIQNCSDTVSGGACQVTASCTEWSSCRGDNCNSCSDAGAGYYSVFSDAGWLWSSTAVSDNEGYVFTVNFNTGSLNMNSTNTDTEVVRCIK